MCMPQVLLPAAALSGVLPSCLLAAWQLLLLLLLLLCRTFACIEVPA